MARAISQLKARHDLSLFLLPIIHPHLPATHTTRTHQGAQGPNASEKPQFITSTAQGSHLQATLEKLEETQEAEDTVTARALAGKQRAVSTSAFSEPTSSFHA